MHYGANWLKFQKKDCLDNPNNLITIVAEIPLLLRDAYGFNYEVIPPMIGSVYSVLRIPFLMKPFLGFSRDHFLQGSLPPAVELIYIVTAVMWL